MGSRRTIAATRAAEAQRGTSPGRQSSSPNRDPVCPQDGYSVGDVTTRNGLWKRNDLLATAAGLASGWRVGAATPSLVGSIRRGGPDRLVEGFVGLSKRSRPRGGEATGPNPTDRGKSGTKRHLVVDRGGIPLAVTQSAANVHDVKMAEATIDAIRPIRRPRGRPRKRPEKLHADKAYDSQPLRRALRKRGIIPRIARRGIDSSERLGRYRWVAERTISWLHRFRRLKVRYERRADIHQAFLNLGCALICWNHL